MAGLKQIECDPQCGFLVRSHDEKELIKIGIEHGKKFHKMTLTENDVKKNDEVGQGFIASEAINKGRFY